MSAMIANNASSRLSASITASSTVISVLPGDGAKYPSPTAGDWFPVTLLKADGQLEICRCTARSGDVLTITRAQEGTSAKIFTAGDRAELRFTEDTFESRMAEKLDKTGGAITGIVTVPTPAAGVNTTQIASAQFADRVLNGVTTKSVAGTGSVTLTAAEAGTGILILNGVLTGNKTVIVPTASGRWIVENATTGAFSLTVKTAAGSGVAVAQGKQQELYCDGVDVLSANTDITDLKWLSQPIGWLIPVLDNMAGADIPPTNSLNFRYIKLTASDAYNTGVLTGEAVSGSFPLVIATATISLSGSPLNGLVVNLINTEQRFLRAGTPGAAVADAMQGHVHTATNVLSGSGTAGGVAPGGGVSAPVNRITTGPQDDSIGDGPPRISSETRPKYIGATYYMRIK